MDQEMKTNAPTRNSCDRIPLNRTRIETKDQAKVLEPGDHIVWQRPYVICHHAIVLSTDEKKDAMIVIHWTIENKSLKILEESIQIKSGMFQHVYRIDYDLETRENNPPELVIERAQNRLNEVGYKLFTKNCETLATYCKTGYDGICNQVKWAVDGCKQFCLKVNISTILAATKAALKNIAREVADDALKAAVEIIPAEQIQALLKASDGVGVGIVFIIEGCYVIYDLRQFYKLRKLGDMTYTDFVQKVIERVVSGLISATATSVGSLLGGAAGGAIGGPVGMMVGSIIGGVIGGIVAGTGGTMAATWFSNFIAQYIKTNDRALADFKELEPGDHIVLFMWFLHPRCHAIVVGHDGRNTIRVIRNTHKKGVVEESLTVKSTIYKVIYNVEPSSPQKVLQRARERIGENKYDLASYNCKTFARYCKTGVVGSGQMTTAKQIQCKDK